MKGLLYKDLFSVFKYYRSYLLLVALFLGMLFVNRDNLFFLYYPSLVTGMITVSLVSVDAREGWNTTCGFLPFTQVQLVGSKYLLGLILNGVIFVLSMGIQIILMLTQDGAVETAVLGDVGTTLITLGLVSPAVMLPFIYRFGPEKGRIVYSVVVGGMAGILGFASAADGFLSFGTIPAVVVALVAVALYGVSFLLSVRFSARRFH